MTSKNFRLEHGDQKIVKTWFSFSRYSQCFMFLPFVQSIGADIIEEREEELTRLVMQALKNL